jgi:hypothetical protein
VHIYILLCIIPVVKKTSLICLKFVSLSLYIYIFFIFFSDYGRARNWWENGNVDHGVFSGWGLTGPRPVNIDSMADSDDTI